MTDMLIAQLETSARGYYYALVNGTKLDVHKRRVRHSIDMLYSAGVSRERIEDILSDVALSIL